MAEPRPSARRLADADARRVAVTELERNVFVEAGAGSGKTTLLVDRVVALVERRVEIGAVAAITFTERAALELTERLRHAFATRCAAEPDGPWGRALEGIDAASIGTLHSFAQRILAEWALDAGLPPSFEVADDARSSLAFERRWRRFAGRLLRAPDGPDDELARAVRYALATGVTTTNLRQLTKALDESWDLAAERLTGTPRPLPPLDLGPILHEADEVVALARYGLTPDDNLSRHLAQLAVAADAVRAAPDDAGRLAALVGLEANPGNKGTKTNWTWAPDGKPGVIAAAARLRDRAGDVRADAQRAALERLAAAAGAEVAEAAAQRRRTGQLEFHDLLVMARDLLRDPTHGPRVRAALHDRYRQLLLDEFQDTDPIQLEIAQLIAADPAAPADPLPPPRPGRVFFVGDPKQSIYRFRRADVGTYLQARRTLGDPVVELTVNFRSTAAVIGWVNKVFRSVITEREGSQAAYRSLVPVRDPLAGPGVLTLGQVHTDEPDAETLREREAADVARAVASAIGNWHVADGEGSRPARPDDVVVLIPTRTVLPALEDALAAAGIPLRVEAGSLLFGGDEIAELLTLVRAVVQPADELAVVGALRTTYLAASERDLFDHHRPVARSFHPLDAGHRADGTPVERALALLGSWHRLAAWASPSLVLGRILDESRGWELAGHDTRPRDAARRLRVLVDQARAFADDTGGTLADWLAWIDRQRAEGARLAEPLVPEPDDRAVRVLTIHAAKGLEFPIVVVAGLSGRPGGRVQSTRVLWPAAGGPPEIKLAKGLTSASFDDANDLDAQLDDDERRRLLYVACTRARDHLVLSLHHALERQGDKSLAALAVANGAAGHGAVAFEQPALPFGVEPEPAVTPPDGPAPTLPSTPPSVVSATALAGERVDHAHDAHPGPAEPVPGGPPTAPGVAAPPAEPVPGGPPTAPGVAAPAAEPSSGFDEADPAQRAADVPSPAASFGLAVHGTLERLAFDVLDRPDGAADVAAAAQLAAAAEGVEARANEVAAAVTVALTAPIMRAAVAAPHWRELYVSAPLGERLLEGYVDLLVRTPDGLVVVDYKTDARPPDGGGVDPHHRVQLAAYAHALEHALGERVVAARVLYCRDPVAPERDVTDLAAAVAELRGGPGPE